MDRIYKIVLTGGPCGGKSTAIPHIRNHFQKLGFNVFSAPEAATILFSNGCSLINASIDQIIKFQSNLMQLQQFLEDKFEAFARSSDKPSIIICDRGMLDGSAFVSADMWQSILMLNNWNTPEIRDKRYDAVFHMITAADGARDHYNHNNRVRTETPDKAIELDHKIQSAWLGHPHLRVIDNNTDFDGKVSRLIKLINNIVSEQPLELEHKYLIKSLNIDKWTVPYQDVFIKQIYLKSDGSTNRIRKRGQDGNFTYYLTRKTPCWWSPNLGNIEVEYKISQDEYIVLLDEADYRYRPIIKTRRCFLWKNQYFELDIFKDLKENLIILEIEVDDILTPIELPPFLNVLEEVTNNPSYSNKELAKL